MLLEELRNLKNRIFKSKISLQVCLLVILFGAGSWIAVNGLWVELPILVRHAPEQWSLPSYLTVIIQLANVGPLIYTVGNKYYPKFFIFKEVVSIHILMILGTFVLALLGILWKETSYIGGSDYSSALLSLSFFVAVVNCSSSVTFLPFMGKFKPVYITAFFVGQGFSGLLPSLVALIQGAGSSLSCCNDTIDGNLRSTTIPVTKNGTNQSESTNGNVIASNLCAQPQGNVPLFSADGFFYFLCAMMIVSELAYIGLNYLPKSKQEQISEEPSLKDNSKHIFADEHKPLEHSHRGSELSVHEPDREPSELHELQELQLTTLEKDSQSSLVSDTVYAETVEDTNSSPTLSMRSILIILLINAILNGLCNGVIPSILSYATLPYGSKEYHLALTLSAIVNPIACTMFYWITMQSVRWIVAWTAIYIGLTTYVVGIAGESPCPIMNGSPVGGVIIVIIAVAGVALVSYLKVCISTLLRNQGQKALLWCGISIQVGSCLGAILMFPLVNYTHIFKQANPCQTCH